jgi:hypothetical protein
MDEMSSLFERLLRSYEKFEIILQYRLLFLEVDSVIVKLTGVPQLADLYKI